MVFLLYSAFEASFCLTWTTCPDSAAGMLAMVCSLYRALGGKKGLAGCSTLLVYDKSEVQPYDSAAGILAME